VIAALLERDRELATLNTLLGAVTTGHGQIALIAGEAGIGKTALVERFVAEKPSRVRSLWGACEALYTPRPLGPLYDIAQQTQGPLRALLEGDTNHATLFAAVLDELTQSPTSLVVEDIHWADEATLDLIKYLARRISRTSALLILTYREEELSRDHPLRLVLGDLPAREVSRMRLRSLSEVAVAALAGQDKSRRSARRLFAATGGNPFFLSEALASDAAGVPTSVSDAVLARVARRSPEAQYLLDVVAVAPGRIERWVLAAQGVQDDMALDECLASGMLQLDGQSVAFRHELARQAVESALSAGRRQSLHTQVLHALLQSEVEPASLARLAHHATAAQDTALVLRFAPAAARQASSQGAHREAVAHYQTALRHADHLGTAQRAELLDGLSNEHYLTGHMEDAISPCTEALALWRNLGRYDQVGHNLRRLSRLSWYLGKNTEAERYAAEAVEVLETQPPGSELALAYANMSHLRMLASDTPSAVVWGERAIALAERLGDVETVCYALNTIGAGEICAGDEAGRIKLERSLAIALEHGYEDHAARAYINLADNEVAFRHYAQATTYLEQGLAYCAEHDLDALEHSLRLCWALALLEQGNWAGAEEEATAILGVPWAPSVNRIPALTVLGMVRLRRGDPGVEAVLSELRDLALATGEMQQIAPMAAARSEWRWLQGNDADCAAEARVGFHLALQNDRPWYWGALALWLWRSGGLSAAPERTPTPFALEISGDWRAAADAWEQIGCPYERALALLNGDTAALREALTIFERLGATPAAEIARQRLRASGVRSLPRGPRPATQTNPAGLTPRQFEILLLLAEGLHNSEIAARLCTTPKTVEHHVSAVLAKLSARSRSEAVRAAYELGLIPHSAPQPVSTIAD
jgi:DNA-binding CsgD family transcriptional regulator